jgi:hypothetical protein
LIDNFLITTLQEYQIFQAGCYTFIPGADQKKRKGKRRRGWTGRKETKNPFFSSKKEDNQTAQSALI